MGDLTGVPVTPSRMNQQLVHICKSFALLKVMIHYSFFFFFFFFFFCFVLFVLSPSVCHPNREIAQRTIPEDRQSEDEY